MTSTSHTHEQQSHAEPIADKCAATFCRIHRLIDLMERDVAEHNSTDFDVIEALLPGVRAAIESLWEVLEASNNMTAVETATPGATNETDPAIDKAISYIDRCNEAFIWLEATLNTIAKGGNDSIALAQAGGHIALEYCELADTWGNELRKVGIAI